MTDTKLCTMTVEEFQKHMASELTALEAKKDDKRLESLNKSLRGYNDIENQDEHTMVAVELYKSDPNGRVKELEARLKELEKKLADKEDGNKELTDEEKKKAEEAKKAADEEEAKKVEEAEAAKKKEEEEKKAKEEAAAKAKEPTDWDSDMGHAVLSASETVAKKKE